MQQLHPTLTPGQEVTVWGPDATGKIVKRVTKVFSVGRKGNRAQVDVPGSAPGQNLWTFYVNKEHDWQQMYSRNTTLLI